MTQAPPQHKCPHCGALNEIVNQCRCDPDNLPTRPFTPGPYEHVLHHGRHALQAGEAIIARGYLVELDEDCPENDATFDLLSAAPEMAEDLADVSRHCPPGVLADLDRFVVVLSGRTINTLRKTLAKAAGRA